MYKKITIIFLIFSLSSCFVMRNYNEKRNKYYTHYPGKLQITGKKMCNTLPKPIYKKRFRLR